MGGTLYVTDSDGNLNVFNVEHDDDGLWLNANYANPDNHWNGDNRWVFRRRNSLHFPVRVTSNGVSLLVSTRRVLLVRRSSERRRVLSVARSNHPASCLSHLFLPTRRCIFCYPATSFPTISLGVFSACPFSEWLDGRRAVFQCVPKSSRWLLPR